MKTLLIILVLLLSGCMKLPAGGLCGELVAVSAEEMGATFKVCANNGGLLVYLPAQRHDLEAIVACKDGARFYFNDRVIK